MRLIAVRHGETEWNVEGREIGQLDSALTPLGVEQAQRLARRLGRMKIDAVYSSDLGRAMETAAMIAAACRTEVRPDPGLRERNMGIFQGLTLAEVESTHPDDRRAYERDRDYAIPDGESGAQRSERSIRTLNAIAGRHSDETVVAVTHSGFLRGFFEWVLGIPPGRTGQFRRDNASYNAFDHDAGRWMLVTWNDTSHLEPSD
jgi:2,3-bisphosphoglycerate-dependent phosphoglycerate mutase